MIAFRLRGDRRAATRPTSDVQVGRARSLGFMLRNHRKRLIPACHSSALSSCLGRLGCRVDISRRPSRLMNGRSWNGHGLGLLVGCIHPSKEDEAYRRRTISRRSYRFSACCVRTRLIRQSSRSGDAGERFCEGHLRGLRLCSGSGNARQGLQEGDHRRFGICSRADFRVEQQWNEWP